MQSTSQRHIAGTPAAAEMATLVLEKPFMYHASDLTVSHFDPFEVSLVRCVSDDRVSLIVCLET
jgi:hypothetical protein